MPTQPGPSLGGRRWVIGTEWVVVHMVTPQGLRCMLLEEVLNASCPVRNNRRAVR